MDEIVQGTGTAAPVPVVKKVTQERLTEIRAIHSKYLNALNPTYKRVERAEEWYRLHNTVMENATQKVEPGKDGSFTAQSAWVFNTVTSKHADHSNAVPTAACLPREPGDVTAATTLNKVLPCLLERFHWPEVWDETSQRKVKLGTGHYKVYWDKNAENGLGEVAIRSISTLNLAWQPTVTKIQDSEYVFQHEFVSKEQLVAEYPNEDWESFPAADYIPEFLPDQERRDKTNLAVKVECWYRVSIPTGLESLRKVLHKVIYVGDRILYASEDDPKCAQDGYYRHGLYPYIFDPLFRMEDSACGLGYVDIGVNPQTAIDILNTAFVKNAAVGAVPRFMTQEGEATIDESELLDTSKAIVHVKNGSIDDRVLREIPQRHLDGNYIAVRDALIQEMRETTGNTETSTGNTSGATAAAAIAALQAASNKISTASINASYVAFGKVMEQVVELIRQFYTLPRYARITGQNGAMGFAEISAQTMNQGGRSATFDISIKATRLQGFDRVAHNELALQFYGLGFFDPAKAEQALMTIDMMDFPGKDALVQKIGEHATLHQKLIQYMQMALTYAQQVDPAAAQMIAQDIMQTLGQEAGGQMVGQMPKLGGQEPPHVQQARRQGQGPEV